MKLIYKLSFLVLLTGFSFKHQTLKSQWNDE